MVDHHLLDLLERNYHVSGWSGSKVAGRPATVVEASTGGAVAARWWIDDATGLLLGQETYDPQGLVTLSRASPSLIRTTSSIMEHLPPDLAMSNDDECTDVSRSPQLTARGGPAPIHWPGCLGRVRTTGPLRTCCIWSTATVCGPSVSSSDEVCCPARRRGRRGMTAWRIHKAPNAGHRDVAVGHHRLHRRHGRIEAAARRRDPRLAP